MLLGIAFCVLDGRKLYGKANARNRYYHCPGTAPARGGAERCRSQMVRADWLDKLAEEATHSPP